ncbi:uncharacterized protein LOC136750546 [Amia ocellicauda]|uniref:uncharacterized protein LOC136750546 n=1 Tax=Amia ocellicauda TaxID=2972642 RepID=UPI0034641498
MSAAGIHCGFLKKYGGFLFKQWKVRFLLLTAEGSLLVCRDADSPPDQAVALQGGCEAVLEGREILDLPRLPPGGRRECCLALILPEDKYLLLMADSVQDCSQWLSMLRKVREGMSSPCSALRSCSRHMTSPLRLNDSMPLGQDTPPRDRVCVCPPPHMLSSGAPPHSPTCLRHGCSPQTRPPLRAVCLLMGGAAGSSALGYLGSCVPSPPPSAAGAAAVSTEIQPPPQPLPPHAFQELGFQPTTCSPLPHHHHHHHHADPPQFHGLDFEADPDFDAFDCGGFTF